MPPSRVMELRHLRYFAAVAESLHFGRAARELHVSQPNLSEQIQALESQIGVELLVRSKRTVTLTAAGRAFLWEAKRSIEHADLAVHAAQIAAGSGTSELRIGYSTSAGPAFTRRLLRSFQEGHPALELVLHGANSKELTDALRRRELDVALLATYGEELAIATRKLWREPLVVALSERHRLAVCAELDLAQLTDERLALVPADTNPALRGLVLDGYRAAGITPRTVAVEPTIENALLVTASSEAVTLLPRCVTEHVPSAGVVYRPLAWPVLALQIVVGWPAGASTSLVEAFVGAAEELAGGQLALRAASRSRRDESQGTQSV